MAVHIILCTFFNCHPIQHHLSANKLGSDKIKDQAKAPATFFLESKFKFPCTKYAS